MNVTISADGDLVRKARELAHRRGTSLNELIRGYLSRLVGEADRDALVEELREHWARESGRSRGWRYRRDDAYEERT